VAAEQKVQTNEQLAFIASPKYNTTAGTE